MSSYGNDLVCKTINGKAPSDHGVIDLTRVLGNGNNAGNFDITNLEKLNCREVDAVIKLQAPILYATESFSVEKDATDGMVSSTWDQSTHQFFLYNLPTTDPGTANQVWNEGGTLKISTGPT